MLTIFAVPKAFQPPFDLIQNQAIDSWVALGAHVVLIGDEEGVAEAAARGEWPKSRAKIWTGVFGAGLGGTFDHGIHLVIGCDGGLRVAKMPRRRNPPHGHDQKRFALNCVPERHPGAVCAPPA